MINEDIMTKPTEEEARECLETLIRYIGDCPEREGLIETPDRILRMWKEIFRGYNSEEKPKITTFNNDEGLTDMIFDCGDYYSMCEHHILPFFGRYYIAYIPAENGKILGLSKIARVVEYCAAKLQLQERLAVEIVDMLSTALNHEELGFAIMMKGTHLCKCMRGVKNEGTMSVVHYTGAFKNSAALRQEFQQMVRVNQSSL